MSDQEHVSVKVVSNPLYFCGVREMVQAIAKRLGFNEMPASQIALAVDEALANVMKHGYERRPDCPIWLKLWPLPDDGKGGGTGLKIVIEDEAKQVDPANIKSRDLEDIRPGGLGVHIIKEVMDEAIFEKRELVGMRLTMVKRVNSAKPAMCDQSRSGPAGDSKGSDNAGCANG
jgi:serine/threonine-protein kinase RsbW